MYLHSLQSQASCRLRERTIRSNRASQFQCQLPLVTAPGSGGQIKSQFVFETAEPGRLIRAIHLTDGLCSLSTATPRKRPAVGARFIPTLHNSVLKSPTDDKQKQSWRRLSVPTGKCKQQVGIVEWCSHSWVQQLFATSRIRESKVYTLLWRGRFGPEDSPRQANIAGKTFIITAK